MNTRTSRDDTDYRQALDWLYDRIDYERTRPAGRSPFRLERIERLLKQLGSPHLQIPAVHIAGTKGKGSTAAMIDAILRQSGLRTGLFTSPHIAQFEERMRVCGNLPTPPQLTSLVHRLRQLLDAPTTLPEDRFPTFFEATTLLAWMFFRDQRIELAVLETGLGGRLDCTNVCRSVVTIITSIGYDHMQILGSTLPLIAAEKAGIIKRQVPIVEGLLPADASAVVAAHAERHHAPRFVCGCDFAWATEGPAAPGARAQTIRVLTPSSTFEELHLPLLGRHQAHNASLAVMACELLQQNGWPQITPATIAAGLRQTHWPLRFEVFDGRPPVILDAAHNPDSINAVCLVLRESEWQSRPGTLIFAVSADKDCEAMLHQALPVFHHVVLTRFTCNPRSVPPETLLQTATRLSAALPRTPGLHVAETPESAMRLAITLAADTGYVLVTGSIFLAAEVRGLLLTDRPPETHAPPPVNEAPSA
ncbi:MAG: bifunctional folylpolyglutamate synthase/dihydrofolate synthase [Planctomycetota bacterium]